MCYLCNWRKGNGDKPANVGKRKYHTPTYNEAPIIKIKYTRDDIQIGDVVFKHNGRSSRRKFRQIGIVESFCLNPHTGIESAKLINKGSYHHLNSIYKQI